MTRDELRRFYEGIYLAAFGAQREPLETWEWALWSGEAPYELVVKLVDERAGIVWEYYPTSRCGLATYLVVAPGERQQGLGRDLMRAAIAELQARGALAVFGEVNDPATTTLESPAAAQARLARFGRWGARLVDVRYVQPALGAGLARDRGLRLIAFHGEDPLPGKVVRAFIEELYAATEGGPPDPSIDIGPTVALILAQPPLPG